MLLGLRQRWMPADSVCMLRRWCALGAVWRVLGMLDVAWEWPDVGPWMCCVYWRRKAEGGTCWLHSRPATVLGAQDAHCGRIRSGGVVSKELQDPKLGASPLHRT